MNNTNSRSIPWRKLTLCLMAVTTLLRMAQLSGMDLIPDEAYYWTWSRHIALGYYDQGPFIAYLIHLTTAVFGNTEFGVRIGVCLLSAGAIWCTALLAERIFSPRAGFLAALLIACTPLMELGSVLATYDPPLVFFWTLSLLLLHSALFPAGGKPAAGQSRSWMLAGLAAGFGLLSKLTMLMMLPSLLLFLLLSPKHRFWLRRPEPWAASLLMLLCFSGVIFWNAHHHWWTFRHLLFLEHKAHHTPLRRLGDFIGSQALLLGPALFLGAVYALLPRKSLPLQKKLPCRFLMLMAAPELLFFCLQALKAKVQGNWVPFGWISALALWAGMLDYALGQTQRARAAKALTIAAAASSLFLTLALTAPPLRQALGIRLPPSADVSNTAYGWHALARRVEQVRLQMQQQGTPVIITGNNYEFPSEMAFYLPGHPQTYDLFLHWKLTQYAVHIANLKKHMGQNAIFLDVWQHNDPDLRKLFSKVEWDAPIPIWRKPLYSKPIATIHLARCYALKRYIGLRWAQGG